MSNRAAQAKLFRSLHTPGNPVVLFNVWDAGSAKAVAGGSAKALATGSWSVAAAHGFEDGQKIPLSLVLDNFRRITSITELPVSVDLEGGYDDIENTVRLAIEAGAIGFNFEDGKLGKGAGMFSVDEQSQRIAAAREAANRVLPDVFINARTDIFLNAESNTHSEQMLDEALERAAAYAKAGGNGFFVPGLVDRKLIARVCAQSPLPVNIMAAPSTSTKELRELGVARISYGPHPYLLAMKALAQAAATAQQFE
jgi:2-methylisocitrate lyase-like PEP mutase family enzyme